MENMEELYRLYLSSKGICTDSRKLEVGQLFFALRGENFDGNDFAEIALENGAIAVVIDDPEKIALRNFYYVPDALTTLQQLAQFHRKHFQIPVIAITGSNGKTTTKELISSVLSGKYRIKATSGNLNNHIGVPLTLLSIQADTEFAIIEMGANHLGEITFLCEIVQPDYGLITNIGKAHLEGFGNLEGVIRAKTELYKFLALSNGLAFVNGKDELLLTKSSNLRRILYNSDSSAVKGDIVDTTGYLKVSLRILNRDYLLHTQLVGAYNLPNILAAACIGNYFGVEDDKICEAIKNYRPSNFRSQFIKTQHNKLVMDAYNANPSSMEAAITNFVSRFESPKAAILGEMLELGLESKKEHQAIVDKIASANIQKLFFVGKNFSDIALPPTAMHFENATLLKDYLRKEPLQQYFILIKGSRGNKLETLLDVL
ncbi:MAG TPA: UDP-N-acetylmuramoyl-tripeptide--D-alanyl-D-alanine ligase [Bacteroidales bacterium]|nr:MAG: UDP-N-acetylmuramoyl-tripeptide--D-alanyl-D-alanine ligase [Bacteroidetes bacterium ADurb.Bin012]HNQ59300.1 UDP-N-acetylmuramoyl-tripeptide--D-alanyl-D-alanine ligase [Bacteroidales bacterium]HNU21884.1 UDP-N-acetylmuramoyl-tripeptide--D-alanyl-D-alanine ligase [Bacteroidales bacterium]HNV16630.1 UDP-N-acetylmuramoyl-tripeptide--D-alanyl-D-alanine ligase [Bacteroidales bacterium]HNZ78608.1 UDP-N-acetylmuramoyl-tripeptide--D-alanyl-D-alanine ligase [Bacteroidales bacterium]